MKKALVETFYLLQGLANLVYALFFVRVDIGYGGSGGAAVGLEYLIMVILLVPSCLSLFAVLALILRRGSYAHASGAVSSAWFMAFYGLIAFLVSGSFTSSRPNSYTVLLFLVTTGIVALNFVALLTLPGMTEKDRKPA